MDWGLENRLRRILRPGTGRTVMLAIDHGYFLGPVTKLEKPGETVEPILPYADALMLARGVLRNCIPPETDKAMVLRVSGGRSIACREDLPDEGGKLALITDYDLEAGEPFSTRPWNFVTHGNPDRRPSR